MGNKTLGKYGNDPESFSSHRNGSVGGETTAGPGASGERLIDTYRRWFDVVRADTEELRDEVYRLRFRVLAVEHAYLDPGDYSDGRELDEFDAHSSHSLLIHRPTAAIAGTVRLVLPFHNGQPRRLPIEDHCHDPIVGDPTRFPIHRMGEVSRFSVSKTFRRRLTDTLYPDALDDRIGQVPEAGEIRRVVPHITLGLMQATIGMAVENGLTHLCATMERQLLRLLARVGVYFEDIGPLVELFGLRQPCFRDLGDLLAQVREERPDVWEVLSNEGRYEDAVRRNRQGA